MKYRKFGIVLSGLLVMGALAACSGNDTEENNENSTPVEESSESGEESENELVQNEDYTEKVKKEDIVLDGQVYVQNGSVMGVMIIKEDADVEDAKKLMEEYAKELKEEYKDMPVNVQAVQDGENLGMITLE